MKVVEKIQAIEHPPSGEKKDGTNPSSRWLGWDGRMPGLMRTGPARKTFGRKPMPSIVARQATAVKK